MDILTVDSNKLRLRTAFTVGIIAAAFLALFFRVFLGGDGPLVLSDEFTYAAQSHALWLHRAPNQVVPLTGNWLYLFLTSSSFAFNFNFYTISRAINILSIVIAGVVLFFTFRRNAGNVLTGAASFAFTVMFAGGYARLFMPEAMQATAIVIATCTFHSFGMKPSIKAAALLGIVLGLSGLIKVHMFLLAPCFIVGVSLITIVHRINWRGFITNSAALLVCMCVTAYIVRLSISGQNNLNLLGDFYTGVAKESPFSWGQLPRYWYVLQRHLATISLVFSPAVLVSILAMCGLRRDASPLNICRCTLFVLILGVTGMLLVTIIFTISAAGTGPYESLTRIHGRYYEHIMILAAVLSSLFASDFMLDVKSSLRWTMIIIIGIVLCAGFFATSHIGWQNPTDFVAVFGLYWIPSARVAALVMGLLTLIALMLWPRYSSWFCVLALSVALTFSAYAYDRLIATLPVRDVDRAAMIVAAETLDNNSRVIVAAPQEDTDLYRAAFYLTNRDLTLDIIPGSSTDKAKCPSKSAAATWLLVISSQDPLHCDKFDFLTRIGVASIYLNASANHPARAGE